MQSRLRIIGIVAFMAVWILAAGPVLAMMGGDDVTLRVASGHERGEGLGRVRMLALRRDSEPRAADGRADRAAAAEIGDVGEGEPGGAVGLAIGRESVDERAVHEIVPPTHGVLQRDGVPVECLGRAQGRQFAQVRQVGDARCHHCGLSVDRIQELFLRAFSAEV